MAMPKRLSTLQIALAVSVAVHVLLGTLRFVNPTAFDRLFEDTPLEVILVNARSNEKPVKAQAIAQASLAGGGEADAGRAASPLPPSPTTNPGTSIDESRKQIEALQEAQQQLLAQMRRELAAMPPPDPRRPATTAEERANEEHRRQLLEHLGEIEKRVNEENARPRKRFVSPATQEAVYAIYYDQWRRRIEERGTRNFPEYQGKKLYGELTLIVTIDAAGRVLETEIVKSSGNRVLDNRAIAIVAAAAPFGSFTQEMKSKADQLVITSRFRFTREEGFEARQLANPAQ